MSLNEAAPPHSIRPRAIDSGASDMNPKILVAEDEADLRALLHRTLSREGFIVDVVEDGDEALDRLSGETFEVLISDVRMPRKGGEQLIPEARRLYPSLKIIVISGYTEIDMFQRLISKGANDFLTKPFKIPDLLERIDRALEATA